jgi:murein DD-endopeptidase MepM/ murein hydrolase activator NlpD
MAAAAVGPLSANGRRAAFPLARFALALALTVSVAPAGAQTLYRFVSAAGHLVYSDRLPTGAELAALTGQGRRPSTTAVKLVEARGADGQAALIAVNTVPAWTQVAYRISASRNLDPGVPRAGNILLPPLAEAELAPLVAIDDAAMPEVDIDYQYLLGHPGARHRPDGPYRLPYARAEAYRVSQAYPDLRTHGSEENRHAVDFEMPVGTPILAARAGLVVEAVGEFRSGGSLERERDRANFVRILHEDGTFAIYGHLAWQSVRVVPGQRVARGQRLADSGNTGFSSGPHLHFVVQLNRAGAMESVPVMFAGAEGAEFRPVTGDRPQSY